jgi:pyruvate/2-oxoacid:ferredoxin oxidoreductase beta subunit
MKKLMIALLSLSILGTMPACRRSKQEKKEIVKTAIDAENIFVAQENDSENANIEEILIK